MFTNLKRIIRWGFIGFLRNGIVSFSSVLVMVIALLMIGSTVLISAFLNATLIDLQDKIDINIYMSTDSREVDVLKFKQSLELLSEVSSVEYISKEDALIEFRDRHQNDYLTIQALEELDENPLRPRLNVQAVSAEHYSAIDKYLSNDEVILTEYGVGFIDKVNYKDNKIVIERMTNLVKGAERIGVGITIILILISILITFNTIRLAIYISKEQIAVMRLVGATNSYVRGPFIVEGILYGVVAGIISLALFYPITLSLMNNTQEFYGGIDLFNYYILNFEEIFVIIMVSGILLGMISSFLAVQRYLKG